jgi:hypothetical protein
VTCPAGRVLRENGRKLFPDANPDVTQYLVGVYDSQSLLSGFINPNDSVFAVYNTDRPNFIPDNNDGLEGPPILTTGNIVSTEGFVGVLSSLTSTITYAGSYLNVSTPIVQAGVNLDIDCAGPAATPQTTATLYPNGDIISYNSTTLSTVRLYANGNIYNTANVSTLGNTYVRGNELVQGNLSTLGNTYVRGNELVQGNASTIGTISYATGLRVPNPSLCGRVSMSTGSNPSGATSARILTVNASGCTSNSLAFLTYNTLSNAGTLTVDSVSNGSFLIASSSSNDSSGVFYFIVN